MAGRACQTAIRTPERGRRLPEAGDPSRREGSDPNAGRSKPRGIEAPALVSPPR